MVQKLVFGAFNFTVPDATNGIEPWITDGTAAGTMLLKDIVVGASGSSPNSFFAVNGKVVFYATDNVNGSELWVTDGTSAGTTLLADINPGIGSAGINNRNVTLLGNKLLFTATNPSTGLELWVTDGTSAGTQILRDIIPGAGSGLAPSKPLSILGTTAIFAADGDIWSTDGTPAGTVKVFDFVSANGSVIGAAADSLFQAGGLVYFSVANNSLTAPPSVELWVTDATASGTRKIANLGPDSQTNFATPIGSVGNTAIFVAQVQASTSLSVGAELYFSDGSSLDLLKDIAPGLASGSINTDPSRVAVVGNKLFFFRDIPGATLPTELWVTDGTAAGTQLLQSLVNVSGSKLTTFGNSIVFTATSVVNGVTSSFAPWISDGTAAGTRLLRDTNPNRPNSEAADYIQFGNKMFFTANGGSAVGKELWVTDGTAAGTTLFKDINPGAGGSDPTDFVVVGDKLLFQATTASGREYWVSDGTPQGTVLIKDIASGSLGSVLPAGIFGSAVLEGPAPQAPTYSISGTPTTAEGGTLIFTVTRDIGTAAGSVALALSGGTATSGADYSAPAQIVSFAAGETSKTVTVATLTDAIFDPNETVTLTLGAITGGGTISPTNGTATGIITDVALVTAVDDNFTTISGVPLSITAAQLTSNDTGSVGIAGIQLTSSAGGTISFENGAYVYRSPTGFTGVDTFTYNAQGAGGVQDDATVRITVTPDPVNAVDDNFTTIAGVQLTIPVADLLSNDTAAFGIVDATQFTASGATVVIQNGTVTYVPGPGFTGVDTFTYNAVGVGGTQEQATVRITVTPDPVNAVDDNFTTIAGVQLTIPVADLLSNDTAAFGIVDATQFTASGATVVIQNGTVTYVPGPGFTGVDTFTYNAVGVGGTQEQATVRITVTPDPVNAVDDNFTTIAGVQLTIPVADLLSNDTAAFGIVDATQFTASGATVVIQNGTVTYVPGPGFTGVDTFTYNAVGVGGTQEQATVRITVTPDPVNAVDDNFTTIAGVQLTIPVADLLSNDTAAFGIVDATQFTASGATVVIQNGTVTYVPGPGFTGVDTFTYNAVGVGGTQEQATVRITVTPDPVNAVDDNFTTIAGVQLTIPVADLLSNDTAAFGIVDATQFTASGATVVIQNGTVTYVPGPGFTGVDTFTYNAVGVGGTQEQATVRITVTPDPVNAVDDNFTTIAGVPLTFTAADLLANDTATFGIDGVSIFSPNGGTLTFENGTYTYRSAPGFVGIDSLSYRAVGVGGTTDTAFVGITVQPDPVDAVDDNFTTIAGVPLTFTAADLLANDTATFGIDGVSIFSPNGGTLTFENGTYTYRSAPGFVGIDSLSYRAVGVGGTTDTAFVGITVQPDPVDAVDDSFVTTSGVALTFTAADLLANDTAAVSIGDVSVFGPNGGTLTFENGTYTYRSAPGFVGIDSLSYRAVGVGGTTDTAFVGITVQPDPVDAVDDSFVTTSGVALTFTAADLLANDTAAVSIGDVSVFGPNGGTLTFENGTYTYRSAPGFVGIDSLSYRAVGVGGTTDTAFVGITVQPDPVDAVDDSFVTTSGVALTFTAADLLANDTAAVSIGDVSVFGPNGGTLTFENGTYTYRSAPGFVGIDSLSYRAVGVGGTTDTAFVGITVQPDPVDAVDDSFVTTSGVALTFTAADLLANDTAAVSIGDVSVFGPNGGTLTFENGTYTYRSAPGFVGIDSLSYRAVGVGGTTDTAFVGITVAPSNAPPVGAADSYTTSYQKTLTINAANGVLANDSDPNGDALRVVGVQTGVAHGMLALNTDGSFAYTPNGGFVGVDKFVYILQDGSSAQSTATALINVVLPDLNVVSGTRFAQTLRGTDGSDVLLMGNTRVATMQGGAGADVFVFTQTDGNGRFEAAFIRDYQVGIDAIDLAGAKIAQTIELRNSVVLVFEGSDRDTLVIGGVNNANQLTFTDVWSKGYLLG